ncbi:MAG TPA: HD domain-containing phosphohydrolase, partial [Candidatus Omnitrophota bacterium]|nr:HD domain-containing phosphohydrolase [Candidatus Omnitrophota bacterium]
LQESHANLLNAQRRADTYRKRLDELVLASHDAILIIEPDGFVSRWNKPANELFGFGSAHRPGRVFSDFLPFAMRDQVTRMVSEARFGHASHAQAFDVAVGLGCRNLLVSAFPLGDPPGTVAVVAQDQTETVLFREQLAKSMEATIEALASAMEARDPYTAGHQRRTAELARRIALKMGLPEDEARGVYTAAVIHDIGKICVPAEILTCPRRLNDAELALIRMHSQAGHDIVRSVRFPWPVAVMILQHHERMDGSGYPNGITGSQIHVGARIIGVADAVEAITNHRPYRAALGLDVARQELVKGKFGPFAPDAVDACLAVLEEADHPLQ